MSYSFCMFNSNPQKQKKNSLSRVIGFNHRELPDIRFRFTTQTYTNIDDYVFTVYMEKVMPVIEKSTEKNLKIQNLVIATYQIDKTSLINLFFEDEEKHNARFKAINKIKNQFGYQYITKANILKMRNS